MRREKEEGKKLKKRAKKQAVNWAALLPTAAILGIVVSLFLWTYSNYLVTPKLRCLPGDTQDNFTVSEEYRGITALLYPQLIIRYETNILVIAALNGYYENNYISFDGTTGGSAQKTNQVYLKELTAHIQEEILEKLTECYESEEAEEISSQLSVYTSILGGVQYENKRGNSVKTYCFIEESGLLVDYDPDNEIIRQRLNEVEFDLGNSRDASQGDLVEEIINTVVEQIDGLYGNSPSFASKLLAVCRAVIAVGAVGGVLFLLVRFLKRFGPSMRKHRRLSCGIAAVVIVGGIGFSAKAIGEKRDEKFTYMETKIASQKDVDVLFTPTPLIETKESETWPEYLERLHIPEAFVGEDANQVMLDYFESNVFEPLYHSSGSDDPPDGSILPGWISLNGSPYMLLDDEIIAPIADEVEKCQISNRPASLYQLERALTDVVLTYPTLDFEHLMMISADAVAAGEQFLTYRDRNIGDGPKPLVMNAEDIALLNGKIYWTLANNLESMSTLEEYQGYLNCFYIAGLKCIEQGRKQASEDDLQYAKLTYYLGNFEERVLRRIPGETALYTNMGENSMRHYSEAMRLLDNRPGYYSVENKMKTNIEQGMETLKALGF